MGNKLSALSLSCLQTSSALRQHAALLTSTQSDNRYADSHHTGTLIRTERQISLWCGMVILVTGKQVDCLDSSIMTALVWSPALLVENQHFSLTTQSSALFWSSHLTLFPLPAGCFLFTSPSDAEVCSACPSKRSHAFTIACGTLLINPGAWSEHLEALLKQQQGRRSEASGGEILLS